MGWESKLGYLSAPKFIIQETNVGHFCKLSFVVIKKIKSENTSSEHPICSKRKVKSSVTHSAFWRGMCCDHGIPGEYWKLGTLLQRSTLI